MGWARPRFAQAAVPDRPEALSRLNNSLLCANESLGKWRDCIVLSFRFGAIAKKEDMMKLHIVVSALGVALLTGCASTGPSGEERWVEVLPSAGTGAGAAPPLSCRPVTADPVPPVLAWKPNEVVCPAAT